MAMQIVIDVNDAGQVSVTGPLENKVVMFGLLEVAKHVVAAHEVKEAPKILRPAMVPMGRG